MQKLKDRYVDSLCAELERVSREVDVEPLRTVFFGGGTPTVLPGALLKNILATCFSCFQVAGDAEISMEANPGTVKASLLKLLREEGVNRISFGVQSFIDEELKTIGRIHSAQEALHAPKLAKQNGFENLSIDLMYGLPGQTVSTWRKSLQTALSLEIQHLSLYQLTVEEETPLHSMIQKGVLHLPDEETIETMDTVTRELTDAGRVSQYEISNYALDGYQCRHNMTYWQNLEYIGVGAGAVSCLQGRRMRNIETPEDYCVKVESGEALFVEEETLDVEASFRETVIMSLRMNKGFSIQTLESRYGLCPDTYYGRSFDRLLLEGFLEKKANRIYLTDIGRRFANRVMSVLV